MDKMERNIIDKVIVITGGAQGIGYAIADKFMEERAKAVVILDIDEAKGREAAMTLNSKHGDSKTVFIKCDVTKDLEEVTHTIFKDFNQVDILVNNAGIINEKKPKKVIEINTIAVVEWSLRFFEYMRNDKGGNGGTILNVGSLYSFYIDPYLLIYKTSKFAVMGFSRCLGHVDNYNRFGVRVLVICPGLVHTKMTKNIRFGSTWEEQTKEYEEMVNNSTWQYPKQVGLAAIKVFKSANSGTAWSVVGGVVEEVP